MSGRRGPDRRPEVTPAVVLELVAWESERSIDDLLSLRHRGPLREARAAYVWLAHRFCGADMAEVARGIGRGLGNQLYPMLAFANRLHSADPDFRSLVGRVAAAIEATV